jgi:ABC-type transport system substrate-binding protein
MDTQFKLQPELALKWESNANATEWTFELRKGVKFHNGDEFNANAVKTSLERYMTEKLANGSMWPNFLGVDVLGDYECKIKFSTPNGALPYTLCTTPMLSPSIIKNEGAAGLEKAVGTGPYKLESWQKGSKITMVKFDGYWDTSVKIYDKLEYLPITEDSTRIAGVQTGDIDLAESIPPDMLAVLKGDKSVIVNQTLAQDQLFLGLKCDKPPFNNLKARQAVMYGLDRRSIVNNVMLGGRPASCMMPVGVLGYNESFPEIPFDLPRAQQLLKESGYNNEVISFIVPIGWYPKMNEQAQAILAQFKAIGFNVNMEMLEGATYVEKRNSGNYNIYTTGAAHQASDPDMFLSMRVKGDSAKSGYVNKDMNNWIDKGREGSTPEIRQAAYEEVMKIMNAECAPMIPIYQMEQIYLLNPAIDLAGSAEVFRADKCMDLRYVKFR